MVSVMDMPLPPCHFVQKVICGESMGRGVGRSPIRDRRRYHTTFACAELSNGGDEKWQGCQKCILPLKLPIVIFARCLVNFNGFPSSGADRDRTDDLLNAIQALSQLSYSPGY